jgi:hypothetical protein
MTRVEGTGGGHSSRLGNVNVLWAVSTPFKGQFPLDCAEVEADPMICEICEHEMADSKPIHSKTALSCGHLFHSACIPHTSRNWGYDCPLCQGPSEITRGRHEWQQQQCAKVFACSLFFLGFYLLALSIALGRWWLSPVYCCLCLNLVDFIQKSLWEVCTTRSFSALNCCSFSLSLWTCSITRCWWIQWFSICRLSN